MLGRVLVRGEGPLGPRRLEVIQPLLPRVHSGLQLLGALERRQPYIRRRNGPAGSSQHVSHPLRHGSSDAWLLATLPVFTMVDQPTREPPIKTTVPALPLHGLPLHGRCS
jgi:hypothetical protein